MIELDYIFRKSLFSSITLCIATISLLLCKDITLGFILFSVFIVGADRFNENSFIKKCCCIYSSIDARRLSLVLIINIVSSFLVGLITKVSSHSLVEAANTLVSSQYDAGFIELILKSILIGFIISSVINSADSESKVLKFACAFSIAVLGFYHCIIFSFLIGVSSTFIDHPFVCSMMLFTMIICNFIGCNLYNIIVNNKIINSVSQ